MSQQLAYDGKALPSSLDVSYHDFMSAQDRPANQRILNDMDQSHIPVDKFGRLADPKDDGDPLIGPFVDQLDYKYQDQNGKTIHENFNYWMRYNLLPGAIAGVDPSFVFMFLIYKALKTRDQQLLLKINKAAGLQIEKNNKEKSANQDKRGIHNEPGQVKKNDDGALVSGSGQQDNEAISHGAQPENSQNNGQSDQSGVSQNNGQDNQSDIYAGNSQNEQAENGRGMDDDLSNGQNNSLSNQSGDEQPNNGQDELSKNSQDAMSMNNDPFADPFDMPIVNAAPAIGMPFGGNSDDGMVNWGGSNDEETGNDTSNESGNKMGNAQTDVQTEGKTDQLADRSGIEQTRDDLSQSETDSVTDDGMDEYDERVSDGISDSRSDHQSVPSGSDNDSATQSDYLDADLTAAEDAGNEYFNDRQNQDVLAATNLDELANNLNDKFDLSSSLFEIKDTPIADGVFNLKYRLKSKDMTRASVLTPIFQVMRQILINEFNDQISNDLIHQLSYGDVVMAYFLYSSAKDEQLSRRLYERYTLAYALLSLTNRQAEALRTSTSLGEILSNNDLPTRVKFFLYMNKHAPQVKKDVLNQVFNRLKTLDDKLDVQTVLLAGQVSGFKESEWADILYGDKTKRALHEIDDSHDDLVAPLKTMRRTRQIRRRNRRK